MLLILLKEFIKLNEKLNLVIENEKPVKLNAEIPTALLNPQTLKIIYHNTNVYVVTRINKKKFDKNLKKGFSNHDINKFISLLEKGVYPFKYMGDWEKYIEISLPEKKKDSYSHLNMEVITDVDYMHAKRVCKEFKVRNLGDYRDVFFKSNTLLLVDVFENFQNMCLKIYELDPVNSLSAPGLTSHTAIKRPK